jgi:putative transposase
MSRPLRIEYPGALYHVVNRGNQRQDVFKSQRDCETFLKKLEHFAELFEVKVYCYCLMTNHFHLLLKTREANLGRFMQSFLTSFTVTVNRRNKKSGHIFQGRYKAHLVENRKYLSVLSRYIHLNPVRVKNYKNASLSEKKSIIQNYSWSSYTAHIGLEKSLKFLDINPVLSSWGKRKEDRMKSYREYVEDGLYKDIENPFELAIRQQVIGSESFAEKVTREKILNTEIKDKREQRALVHFQKSMSPEKVISCVAGYFEVSEKEILSRKGGQRVSRKLAMYLCCNYCTSHTTLTEIGKLFGVTLSGLTRTRDRVTQLLAKDKGIKKYIIEIKKSIAEV